MHAWWPLPAPPLRRYVHRSGRTARALSEGLAMALVAPEDVVNYRKVIRSLNDGEDLSTFPVEVSVIPQIHKRIALASKIDVEQRANQKKSSHNNWFLKNAAAMDIELDESLLVEDDDAATKSDNRYVKNAVA
jgi:ATP-dependent RNA helicase DDX24/MAK5